LSLEDLYTGVTKKMKITRSRLQNGKPVQESKVVQIDVKPGWKSGTKITFEGDGDEDVNMEAGDVVFQIEEEKHQRFTRRDADLVYRRTVTLEEALCGTKFDVTHLDNKTVTVDCSNDLITPKFVKRISGRGMPKSKSTKGEKGDLVVEFDIVFPSRPLTDEQKKKIKEARLS
jgi:DnaJ family protein B protein 4